MTRRTKEIFSKKMMNLMMKMISTKIKKKKKTMKIAVTMKMILYTNKKT
jgi:hypothetical protein